jgi:glycosyltransferase involved in cell wall biosynthesis
MTKTEIRNPLVSICIPMYNVSEYIEETLQRILKQSYENIEIVVVDDHSTDNSYLLAKSYESDKLRVYKNAKKGGNSARNYAFEKAKGEYIKFMDADDYCSDSMVKEQVKRAVYDGTSSTLIHSPLRMLDPDGSFFDPPRSIDKDYSPGIELLVAIWKREGFNIPHSHLMHRNLVVKSGGWDERILKNQDGEFFARVAAEADQSLSVNNVFAIWRQTKKGVSTQTSLAAHLSVIDSFEVITEKLIQYKNSSEMRILCGKYIGGFVYENYPQIKSLLPKIDILLKKIDISLLLPNRKVLKMLSSVFGWKIALLLIKKLKI